jgi:hypothetical protein
MDGRTNQCVEIDLGNATPYYGKILSLPFIQLTIDATTEQHRIEENNGDLA